ASTEITAEQLGLSAPYAVIAESETEAGDHEPAGTGEGPAPEVTAVQIEAGEAGGWLHPYEDLRGLAGPVGLTGLAVLAQQHGGPSVPAIPPQVTATETLDTTGPEPDETDEA